MIYYAFEFTVPDDLKDEMNRKSKYFYYHCVEKNFKEDLEDFNWLCANFNNSCSASIELLEKGNAIKVLKKFKIEYTIVEKRI